MSDNPSDNPSDASDRPSDTPPAVSDSMDKFVASASLTSEGVVLLVYRDPHPIGNVPVVIDSIRSDTFNAAAATERLWKHYRLRPGNDTGWEFLGKGRWGTRLLRERDWQGKGVPDGPPPPPPGPPARPAARRTQREVIELLYTGAEALADLDPDQTRILPGTAGGELLHLTFGDGETWWVTAVRSEQ